jgi:hypothetical protein
MGVTPILLVFGKSELVGTIPPRVGTVKKRPITDCLLG